MALKDKYVYCLTPGQRRELDRMTRSDTILFPVIATTLPLAYADATVLPRPGPKIRRPLLALVGGAEVQPLSLLGIDRRKGLPRDRAEGVRPVHGLGLPRRVDLESAPDRGGTVGQRHHERVAGEGHPRLAARLDWWVRHAVPLVVNLPPSALELVHLLRGGVRASRCVGVSHSLRPHPFGGPSGPPQKTVPVAPVVATRRRPRSKPPRCRSDYGGHNRA